MRLIHNNRVLWYGMKYIGLKKICSPMISVRAGERQVKVSSGDGSVYITENVIPEQSQKNLSKYLYLIKLWAMRFKWCFPP